MKKKKNILHITTEKYNELNREFYNSYYSDYFTDKLIVLGSLYSNQEELLTTINSNDITIEKLCFYPNKDTPYITNINPLVKMDLTALYYHSIETFLRIFLAHCTFKLCPWLELSRVSSYSKFKECITELSKGNFNLSHSKWTQKEIILNLFYCKSNIHDILNVPKKISNVEATAYLKEWITWSARELLEVYDYNAYKHGLSLYSKPLKMELQVTSTETIESASETMVFIGKEYTTQGILWKKIIQFTPLGERGIIIHILSMLIKDILVSGEHRYLNTPLDKIFFVGSPPSAFFENTNKNKFNLTISKSSTQLGYD